MRPRLLVFQRFGLGEGIAGLSAEGIIDKIARDAEEPGAELGRLPEIGELAPGGDEDLLREVFAAGDIAAGAVGQGADRCLVAGDNLPEGIALAAQTQFHKPGVAGRFQLKHLFHFIYSK